MQKKLHPIICSKDDYLKLKLFVDSLDVDYSETEWMSIRNETTGEFVEAKVVACVVDGNELVKIINHMNYQFV